MEGTEWLEMTPSLPLPSALQSLYLNYKNCTLLRVNKPTGYHHQMRVDIFDPPESLES